MPSPSQATIGNVVRGKSEGQMAKQAEASYIRYHIYRQDTVLRHSIRHVSILSVGEMSFLVRSRRSNRACRRRPSRIHVYIYIYIQRGGVQNRNGAATAAITGKARRRLVAIDSIFFLFIDTRAISSSRPASEMPIR